MVIDYNTSRTLRLLVGHWNNQLLHIVIDYFGSQKQYKVSIHQDHQLPHIVINYHDSRNAEQWYFSLINRLQLLLIN